MGKYFGTDGIRGKATTQFPPLFVFLEPSGIFSRIQDIKNPNVSLKISPVLLALPTIDHVLVGLTTSLSHLGQTNNYQPHY